MKKRLTALLSIVFLCIAMLSGCGAQKEELDIEYLSGTVETLLYICQNDAQSQLNDLKGWRSEQLDLALIQSGIPCEGSTLIKILSSWVSAEEEMGPFIGVGDFTFKEQNGEINGTAEAEYQDRTAEMTFTFDQKGDVKALSVGAHYSTKEILTKAGLNTILGMGIVFVVLVFIAVIIWLMGIIVGGNRRKRKKPAATVTKDEPVKEIINTEPVPVPVIPEEQPDDTELIAVITAAICAATGASGDEFVVRNIRRRSRNNWKQN